MKKERGITLIALVITIIVLLILAGVVIQTLTGDNGVLRKAADSKNANIVGAEKEKIQLGYNEYKMKKYTETEPQLIVEGATVNSKGNQGWDILFEETQNKYELSADGNMLNGPVTNDNESGDGESGNTQPEGNINFEEQGILDIVSGISSNYSNLLGGSTNEVQFRNKWVGALLELDLGHAESIDIQSVLSALQQILANFNSADALDAEMPQLLSILNSTCGKYGFIWSRDNTTRMWDYNIMSID